LIYLFVISGMFTARSVMAMMLIAIASLNIYLLLRGSLKYKLFSIINIGIGAYFIYYFVLPILFSTVTFLKDLQLITFASSDTENLKYSFSSGTEDVLASMWFLPGNLIEVLFGAGFNPDDSDVGYIKLIF